jgi:hypothetical protein
MRCTILIIFVLLPQLCASQTPVQSNLKANKPNKNYYLVQTIDTDFLIPPKGKPVILSGFVPTLVANLTIAALTTSESEFFIRLLKQINVDLKKHNMDSILKERFSNIVRESDLKIKNELAFDRYNKNVAKIGDKVILLNTNYVFDKKMEYIQVLVTLKIRKVKRFTNRGRKNQRPKYEAIYENKFMFISSILSENGGSKAIIAERKREANDLYKLELVKIEQIKSSKFRAQKKSRLDYSYRNKMKSISRVTEETLKKEALTRLWVANGSARVISALNNASLELARMLEIDLSSYQSVRNHKSYKQLVPFTKRLGIIEQKDKRAIVINHSNKYCSLPLSADPKYCF